MKQQDLIKHHHASLTELADSLAQKRQLLVDTRLKDRPGQEKNVHLASSIRHDIARIHTIIRHRQLTGKIELKESPTIKPNSPHSSSKPSTRKTSNKVNI
jgi:ribosomal protein L29